MKTAIDLTADVDCFTLLDLLRKAAAHKGLELREGASRAYSEPIKVYDLNAELLAILAQQGIRRQTRPDCRNEIFTLVDENPQEKVPGWSTSNYWNFRPLEGDKRKFDLRVTLSVGFSISTKERGFILWPQAHSPFVSPFDRLPNFRMFRALVESDDEAPVVAMELAASDGSIAVTWTDLGLGGIRTLATLFAEFAGQNEIVMRLGRNGEIFSPAPYLQHQQPGDKLFVVEPAQPRVFQEWEKHLED